MKLGNFETTAATQVFLLIHFYHFKMQNHHYYSCIVQESYGFKDVVDGNGRSRLTYLVAKSYFLFKIAVDW